MLTKQNTFTDFLLLNPTLCYEYHCVLLADCMYHQLDDYETVGYIQRSLYSLDSFAYWMPEYLRKYHSFLEETK